MKKIPLTLKAVAAFKHDYLTAESVELDIVDGIVVGIRHLTRAPDQHSTAVAQCIPILWSTLTTNKPPRVQDEEPAAPKPIVKKGS